jgi:hypothetical protein
MINYVVISTEFVVTFYMPYAVYNDIVRYYDVNNALHAHECIQTHHTLAIL